MVASFSCDGDPEPSSVATVFTRVSGGGCWFCGGGLCSRGKGVGGGKVSFGCSSGAGSSISDAGAACASTGHVSRLRSVGPKGGSALLVLEGGSGGLHLRELKMRWNVLVNTVGSVGSSRSGAALTDAAYRELLDRRRCPMSRGPMIVGRSDMNMY